MTNYKVTVLSMHSKYLIDVSKFGRTIISFRRDTLADAAGVAQDIRETLARLQEEGHPDTTCLHADSENGICNDCGLEITWTGKVFGT